MPGVHLNEEKAPRRRVDAGLVIVELCSRKDFPFDLVGGDLDGVHPKVVNYVSDRAYYILEGSGTMDVGDEHFSVAPGDVVSIKAGTPHSLEGKMKYLIVTSPPFDPKNEQVLGS